MSKELINQKAEKQPHLLDLVAKESVSRRQFVHWLGASASTAVFLTGVNAELTGTEKGSNVESTLFHFQSVPISKEDTVVVPDGYVAEVLYRWGDPINGQGPQFKPDASNSADDQLQQAGMGHDGMEFFEIPGQDGNVRGLLAINHEYTDQVLLFADGFLPLPPEKMPLEKVRKSIASHGVSIVEVQKGDDGAWRVVASPYARRVTADTPARITGPASSKLGDSTRGTVCNCAAGRTPWGTYLTCEENFQSVFGTNDPNFVATEMDNLYGLQPKGFYYTMGDEKIPGYRWWEQNQRFDLAHPDNDSKRFGYVVEIDPLDAASKPIKRTALGRFRHENAELTIAPNGQVVVYMGDDEVNQFVYKFVSADKWDKNSHAGAGVTESAGLLDRGTLYAARFNEDGTGTWLELAPGKNNIPAKASSTDAAGFDAADICIYTREAARIAGATPMDRPEWLAVHPTSREVYVTLTNNKSRHTVDAANPREKNVYGHILRWREVGNDPTATQFQWDIFLLGGNPANSDPNYQGTSKGDSFACPDGLKFDSSGILWIQTDMSSSVMGKAGFEELGHNMMLAGDPATGQVRRFLTGPRGCEITGIALTPDRTTMFANIQHPGEPADELSDMNAPQKYSVWPDGPSGGRPRSATIAIRKKDGGKIGS